MARSKDKTPSRKKKPSKIMTAIKSIFLMGLLMAAFLCIYAGSVIAQAPEIDTSNIYAFMSESSTLYDDQGNVIDSVFTEGGNRVNLTYDEMPVDLINAVVAMEDKSFWEHHGFNVIRIFGAIKEKLFSGGQISGTSTITQQLARNIYLADVKSERSMNRKITEAWYAVLLERNLTKEQIIEAYLNTIYLGYNCYGVEAAANAYFNKSAKDLDLVQCVALAAIPQNPQSYAPLRTYSDSDFATISESIDPSYVIKETDGYVTVYNGESSQWRRETTLNYMEEQGYITAEQKAEALETDLLSEINVPKEQHLSNSYFNDFVINEVIDDLVESGYTEENARKLIYTGGLQIYTTLNQQAQDAIETEFNNPDNFPSVEYYNNQQDDEGNIYNKDGDKIILYSKDRMLQDDVFYFKDGEFTLNDDGSVTLIHGKRLNFYNTTSNGVQDITIEFKPMYQIIEGAFYSLQSCSINIPVDYKSYDDNGDVVVSAQYFEDYPDFFTKGDGSLSINKGGYNLSQLVRQPQAAMVICDNKTGAVKAMVGGRAIKGELMYNRATSPRQTGSSIKPLAVYSAALQIGADAAKDEKPLKYQDFDENQISEGYGYYWTAASKINDREMIVDGKVWPKNVYSDFKGIITLRRAVEISCNIAAVRVFQQVGADYSADLLKKFGITTIVEEGDVNDMNPAALALGGLSRGISPLEMASAYTTFPALGVHTDYTCYTEVKNSNGEVILQAEPEQTRVIDEGVAWIMADIMRTVVENEHPEAYAGQVTAGKTGTTSDKYDAWFCGFTPQYTGALWIGNDINLELNQGSEAAARLWGIIMTEATEGMSGDFVPQPDSVLYQNGEYFVAGTQYGVSDLANDIEVDVCKESGYLATPYCKDHGVVKMQPKDEHAKYYCPLHNKDDKAYPIAPGQTLNKDFKTDEELAAEEAEKKRQEEEEKKRQEEEEKQRQEEEQRKQQEEQEQQQQQEQTEPDVVPDSDPEGGENTP